MTSLAADGNAHSGIVGTVANPLMRVKPYVCAEGNLGRISLSETSARHLCAADRQISFRPNLSPLPGCSVRLPGQAVRQLFQSLDLLPQLLNLCVLRL